MILLKPFLLKCLLLFICLNGIVISNNLQHELLSGSPIETITVSNKTYIPFEPQYHNDIHRKPSELDNISKIKRGKMIDPTPKFEPPEEKKDEQTKIIRQLSQENTLSKNTGFIPIDTGDNQNLLYYAQRYILGNLKPSQSSILIYPYKFTYTPLKEEGDTQEPTATDYQNGGAFSFNPENFPKNSSWNFFNYTTLNTDVQIGKAKALYDANFAILKIQAKIDGDDTDLFYESDSYSNYFVSSMAKGSTVLYGKTELLTFKENNPQKSGVAFYNHTEIINDGLFSEDGTNLIGFLIIPDHVLGSDSMIDELLTETGINKIKQFVKNGGTILVSGKSGYLLEKWGILETGTYRTDKLLTTTNADSNAKIKGFENTKGATPQDNSNFNKQLLCMGLQSYTFLLSTYPLNDIASNNLEIFASYDSSSSYLRFKDAETGIYSALEESDKLFLPFLMFKDYNKGKIIILNSNPLLKNWYTNVVFNSALVALARNVVFNSYVKFGEESGLPIPGGEGGIKLSAVVEFWNLYDTPTTDFQLHVFLPNKVAYSPLNSGCQIVSETISGFEIDSTLFDMSTHMKCTKATIAQFEKYEIEIKLEILDASVTQKSTDITIIYPVALYKDGTTQVQYLLDNNGVKVEAKLGAILRGAINPDPSSTYPFPGKGYPADNVLQVENKENTIAKEVVYYGVIPLVSPLVDGSDQGRIAISMEFYKDYYLSKINAGSTDYTVPFTNSLDKEYLDFQELSGKNIILGAEWEQAVKIEKLLRSEVFTTDYGVTSLDIGNINYSTQIDDPNIILQQIDLRNADQFFELGTQRLMPYIDTTHENGAKLFYGETIPENKRNPTNPKVSKKPIIFSRNDVYFYDSLGDYQMPRNIDESFVISIDKFPKPTRQCSDVFGKADIKPQINGTFTHNEGLIPNQWENLMFRTCNRTQYDPTKPEQLAKLGPDISLIHYLVPVTDVEVTTAEHLMGFKLDTGSTTTGYLEEYDVVKFIYAHGTKFKVKADDSRQGGRLEFTLPSTVSWKNNDDPIEKGYITYSADQVAFYKTEVVGNKIIAYFKRGLMPNEAYGKDSNIGLTIENLNPSDSFSVDIVLYEVKYDISSPETDYEHYEERTTYPVTFYYTPYYSLPAIEIGNKMNRNNSTEIKEYELLMPYTRYGVYQQELIAHRTVYGFPEVHNVKDPGLVSTSGGFGTISNIGTSSIPFVEYVTHGASLLIPNAPRTSRLEWIDIWGRHWAQPLRSVFPDIPPIPPPLKNFVMSTTYELLDSKGKERLLEWPSDEEAYIHVQMKFLNNFPKFFLSTNCRANAYPYYKDKINNFANERVFTSHPDFSPITDPSLMNEDNKFIAFGFSSVYGKCYQKEGTILKGQKLTQADFDKMDYAMSCSATNNADEMKVCLDNLKDIKTLNRRGANDVQGKEWNYSPDVESFYPEGFIKDNMWDLTHYDYDDNAMDKAYKYHCDNSFPSLDINPPQNPAYEKPHNVVTFPLFKGFGYKMEYSQSLGVSKFPGYQGWWSDNLQNKDDTLLAGQSKSNDISVGKDTLLPPSAWINWRDIESPLNNTIIPTRLKNIYTCLYNQHRIKISPGQKIYAYPNNVYQNNVVPIMPDLDENDIRLTDYPCTEDVYQYSPQNISKVDNIVETVTDRDWLYFAVNLRGGAKENINVLMKILPFDDGKYEGITKVQDGGRFVYWNPVNGPNSFLMVDNPVNTVEASRVDLTVTSLVFPSKITTYKSEVYQIYTVEDPSENLREFTQTTYTNSYGFGDSAVTVYVGGTKDSICKVNEGESTYIKIAFYNNCGFDWNMKGGAITFQDLKSQAINADDLLKGIVHTIQKPIAYNFLTLEIPDEFKDFIKIEPSDHNIQTAPQFFDFQNINVVTIRDGFEGDYFYKLTVLDNFPPELKGRLLSIGVKINSQYFDRLPSVNDEAKHDYTLQVPPIKFGVPYTDGNYKGKIFYTFGRADNVYVVSRIFKELNVEGVRFIDEETIESMRNASLDSTEAYTKMRTIWEEKLEATTPINYALTTSGSTKYFNCYINETIYKQFPKENRGAPDTTKFSYIAKMSAEQIEYGYQPMIYYTYVKYTNWRGKSKSIGEIAPATKYSTATGAWIKVSYSYAVVTLNDEGKYVKSVDQRVFASDSGVVQVNITAKNTGNDISYNTKFDIYFDEGVSFITNSFNGTYDFKLTENSLALDTKIKIVNGESYTEVLYFAFSPVTTTRRLDSTAGRTIIKQVFVGIDLTETQGEVSVTQAISEPFIIYFPGAGAAVREAVSLKIANSGNYLKPVFTVIATPNPEKTNSGADVRYKFYRQIKGVNPETPMTPVTEIITENFFDDTPLKEEQTSASTSYSVLYRVETYDEKGTFLASNVITYSTKLPGTEDSEDEDQIVSSKKSFPIWAAILIGILGCSFVFLVGYGIYRLIISKRAQEFHEITVEKTHGDLVNEKGSMHNRDAHSNFDVTKRVMIKGEEIKVHRFSPRQEIELNTQE